MTIKKLKTKWEHMFCKYKYETTLILKNVGFGYGHGIPLYVDVSKCEICGRREYISLLLGVSNKIIKKMIKYYETTGKSEVPGISIEKNIKISKGKNEI